MAFKIKKLSVFYFLTIAPFIPIDYVSHISTTYARLLLFTRMFLLMFFSIHLILVHKKITIPFALAVVYFLGCAISTFWAGAGIIPLIAGGINLFGLILLIEDGIFSDIDALISGMLILFEMLVYANLIYYILHPAGYSGYSYSGLEFHRFYLFGNYSSTIKKLFPGIMLGGIHAFRTKNRITLRYTCMCLALTFFLFRVRAMTALMGMLVFVSAILYYSFRRKSGIFKYEYFIVVSTLISVLFAVLRRFTFAEGFITNILGKNMTLTNRTFIWENTIKKICERPLLGFGQINIDVAFDIIGGAGPHNMLLGTLFYGGILGLVILVFIFIVFWRKIYIDRRKKRLLTFIFDAAFCACFVMWCFERFAPIYEFYRIYVIFVMAYYCKEFEKGSTFSKIPTYTESDYLDRVT